MRSQRAYPTKVSQPAVQTTFIIHHPPIHQPIVQPYSALDAFQMSYINASGVTAPWPASRSGRMLSTKPYARSRDPTATVTPGNEDRP